MMKGGLMERSDGCAKWALPHCSMKGAFKKKKKKMKVGCSSFYPGESNMAYVSAWMPHRLWLSAEKRMTERNLHWPEKRALGNGPKLYRLWTGGETLETQRVSRSKRTPQGFKPRRGGAEKADRTWKERWRLRGKRRSAVLGGLRFEFSQLVPKIIKLLLVWIKDDA